MAHFRRAALTLVLCMIPQVATANGVDHIRSVQIVSMHNVRAESAEVPQSLQAASSMPPEVSFRVYTIGHDKSRKVDTTPNAAGQLSLTQKQPRQAAQSVVSTRSSISVPPWMSNSDAAIGTVATRPGCTSRSYRPTGFLKARAEIRRARYYGTMSAIACEHGIPEGLFDAMIIQESRYDPDALSSRNARGLIQLMPGTARELGVDPDDPVQNLRGGARYFRKQFDRFGQVHLALAAYNAGPARIRGNAIPAIAETRSYVSNILGNWSRLAQVRDGSPAELSSTPAVVRTAAISIF